MSTIDLSKANFSLGDPLYRIDGDFGEGEFLRFATLTKRTQVLQGVNGDALVMKDRKKGRSFRFELTLLESSTHNKYLFAAHETGVGLPLFYQDGDTKIVGSAQIEDIPDTAKSAAGTTRTWVIFAVNAQATYGAAASAG